MKAARTILLCLALGPLGAFSSLADDGAAAPASATNSPAAAPRPITPYFSPTLGVRPMDNDSTVTPATPPDVRPSLSPLLSFRAPTVTAAPAPVQVLPTMTPAPAVSPKPSVPAPPAVVQTPAPAPSLVPAPVPTPSPPAVGVQARAVTLAPDAAPVPVPSFPAAAGGVPNYTIHAGDTLAVTLAGQGDFDGRAVVQNSGSIALPYVQEIKVEGLTIPQATAAITKRLSEYYVNPVVSVDVAQFRKKEFVILGQVSAPGVYPFSPDQDSMSLLEAIAKAGGVKQYGDLGHVTIKRIVDGKEQILTVNAREAKALSRNQEGLSFQVLPGDSIVIALFRNEINLLGEVRRPGIYTLPPLLDSIDLIEAIAMAGGTTDGKDLGIVHVKRQIDGKVLTLNVDAKDIGRNKADANFPVYAGDTMIVEVIDNEFIVLGQANHPGSFHIPPFHDSVDLIEAIAMAGGATRLADTSHITIRRMVNGKATVIKADAQKLARSASAEQIDVLPGDRIVIPERIF